MENKTFAVIYADVDFDYVTGLECEKLFSSYEEAQKYLDNINKECNDAWYEFTKYIDEYLESIKVPEFTTYKEWLEYGKHYLGYINSYTHPKNFKEHLRDCLRQGYGYVKESFENYNPPKLKRSKNNLFIVEIKEKENGSS